MKNIPRYDTKEAAEASQCLCKSCPGLDDCQQAPKGYVRSYEVDNGIAYTTLAPCKLQKEKAHKKKRENLFRFAKIPKEFMNDDWSSYNRTKHNYKAISAGMWLAKNKSKGAVFFGPTGTGKTKLAAIIANEKIKAGDRVIFSSVPDLLQDIKSTFGKPGETEAVLKEIRECDCIILDDLGAERMTTWVAEVLFNLINYRMAENLQTIITTNYSPKTLAARLSGTENGKDNTLGQRLISRLYKMCYFVEIAGPDYRFKNAKIIRVEDDKK